MILLWWCNSLHVCFENLSRSSREHELLSLEEGHRRLYLKHRGGCFAPTCLSQGLCACFSSCPPWKGLPNAHHCSPWAASRGEGPQAHRRDEALLCLSTSWPWHPAPWCPFSGLPFSQQLFSVTQQYRVSTVSFSTAKLSSFHHLSCSSLLSF